MRYQIPWPWSYMIYQNNVDTIASCSLFNSLLILPPILSLTFCSMVGTNKMLSFFCPKITTLGNQIELFVQSIHLPSNIFLVLFVHLCVCSFVGFCSCFCPLRWLHVKPKSIFAPFFAQTGAPLIAIN